MKSPLDKFKYLLNYVDFFKPKNHLVKNIRDIFLFKIASILLSLIVIPTTISYLGSYKYGIWITLTSAIGWISLFDFGFGNGLRNKLSEAILNNKFKLARVYISSTYIFVITIFILVGVIASILFENISISVLLGISNLIEKDVNISSLIVIWVLVFQLILSTIFPILYSFSKPEISSIYNFLYQLLLFLGILMLHNQFQSSLVNLAILWGFVNLIILLGINYWFFQHHTNSLTPHIKFFRKSLLKNIFNIGFKFFVLQIVAVLYYESNNILITKFIGPDSVSIFSVVFKYMSIPSLLINIILTPLWNEFTKANLTMNYKWLQDKVRLLRITYTIFVFIIFLMILISQFIFEIWLNGSLFISFGLVCLMGIWQIFNIWNSIHSTIIYGIGKIQLQLYASIAVGLFNIPSSIFASQNWGLEGMVINQIILNVLVSWLGYIQVNKLIHNSANGIWNR